MDIITGTQLIRFLAALILVVGMMLGLGLIMRRVQHGKGMGGLGSKRRLRITEILPLDSRHRAILLRRDDREHLVILGPTGETVVESGIMPPQETENNA